MDLTYDLGLSEVVICRQPAGRGVGDDGPWLKSQGPATERLSARRRATTLPAERRTAESNDEISSSSAASVACRLHCYEDDGWEDCGLSFVGCVESGRFDLRPRAAEAGARVAMAVGLSTATIKGRIIAVEE